MQCVRCKIYLQTVSSVTVVFACIQFSISEPANSIVLREDVPGDITACMKSRYDFNHCRIVPHTYARTHHNALQCSSVSHETWGSLRLAPMNGTIKYLTSKPSSSARVLCASWLNTRNISFLRGKDGQMVLYLEG